MSLFDQTRHQKKQIGIINNIESQIKNNSLNFSIVEPIHNYNEDPRLCLTGIHLPKRELLNTIYQLIIEPLKQISPSYYYYEESSLHLTIKSVRVVNDPPHFNEQGIEKAGKVFAEVIPKHHQFRVYFYRLLLFPNSLALIGTTDPELDEIILELDKKLKEAGIPDDKQYTSSRYFFSSMTLARFNFPLSKDFIRKVSELSAHITALPYIIDSVTLVSCNAVFKKRKTFGIWNLL